MLYILDTKNFLAYSPSDSKPISFQFIFLYSCLITPKTKMTERNAASLSD